MIIEDCYDTSYQMVIRLSFSFLMYWGVQLSVSVRSHRRVGVYVAATFILTSPLLSILQTTISSHYSTQLSSFLIMSYKLSAIDY